MASDLPPAHLPRAPLAFENPVFLDSPDGRILRILAEYQEPIARFTPEEAFAILQPALAALLDDQTDPVGLLTDLVPPR